MNNVGVDAVSQRNAGNRRAWTAACRHNLGLEFGAVGAPLGVFGDRLARHGVHDLHRAHHARLLERSQDGFAARLPFFNLAIHPACLLRVFANV